ncbi:hypothetical protein SynROS8604_01178 [Synechococcus sp. ROS8604]|nr:hypothetical protein SynROS8604_01178 [Synechococcus sp. ROS8604]
MSAHQPRKLLFYQDRTRPNAFFIAFKNASNVMNNIAFKNAF